MQKPGAVASARKNLAVELDAATAPRASRSSTAGKLLTALPGLPATPASKPAASRSKITGTQVATTVEKPKTPVKPAKTPAKRITQRTAGSPAQTFHVGSDDAQEEEDSEAAQSNTKFSF